MTEFKVRQQYDQMAAKYDQRWSEYVARTLSFLKSWVEISPELLVLDVACGTGEFEQMVLTENPVQQMIGIDLSEQMLMIAQEKCRAYQNVSFCMASASKLPFPNNYFDVIVSASSFHYFDDPKAALEEMKRVLKPNGKLVILDWCKDYFLCRVFDVVLQLSDPAHKHCYTQDQFHRFLTSTGFEVDRAARFQFGVLWGLMITSAYSASSFPSPLNQ